MVLNGTTTCLSCGETFRRQRRYITGMLRVTAEFLQYALVLATEPPDPKARMKAFLKYRYGQDFIEMVAFTELKPHPTLPTYFQYAARAVIWVQVDAEGKPIISGGV